MSRGIRFPHVVRHHVCPDLGRGGDTPIGIELRTKFTPTLKQLSAQCRCCKAVHENGGGQITLYITRVIAVTYLLLLPPCCLFFGLNLGLYSALVFCVCTLRCACCARPSKSDQKVLIPTLRRGESLVDLFGIEDPFVPLSHTLPLEDQSTEAGPLCIAGITGVAHIDLLSWRGMP